MNKILTIFNGSDNDIKLILEPWAEEYTIESQNKVEVISNINHDSDIEIEYGDCYIVVHGWRNSILTVTCDGKEISPG